MNVSLPDDLKEFAEEQTRARSFGTTSEYVRALIRRDQDTERIRALLLAGAESPAEAEWDDCYFSSLRARISG